MNTTDVLRQAKELLSEERNWTQTGATWVRRPDGGMSYCVLGAISQVLGGDDCVSAASVTHHPATCAFGLAIGGRPVGTFNDETTHVDLIDAFDRALILAAEQEKVDEKVPVAA